MERANVPRRRGVKARWYVIAVALVTAILAPVQFGSGCVPGETPSESICTTWQRSLLGTDTQVGAWLIGVAAVVAAIALWSWWRGRAAR